MALSDTARLISSLELEDKFSKTAGAGEKALGGLESKSNFVTKGFGLMGRAGGAVGNAFGHLKGRIGQLISGPLGMIGLGAGLFSIGKLLTDGIGQAQDFGKQVGRLAALTGLSTEATSKLAGAFTYFGIATDDVLQIVGLAEKNLGKLTATGDIAAKQAGDLAKAQRDLTYAEVKLNEVRSKRNATASQVLQAENRVADAQAELNALVEDGGIVAGGAAGFYKKYGLALVDSSGKVKDFNTLLLDSADFWNNKVIPAETKAAALATLYGRSWQTLIPILSAGRKGIADAEEQAAELGLTLTKDNLAALGKLKKATRDWGQALGGLKLQLGLAVIPLLTDLTTGAFNFLRTADQFGLTGSQKIVGFFKDVIVFGQKAFGIIQDRVVPIVKKVIDGWNNLPEPLKGLLVKGVAGNFAVKFLLGFDPIAIAGAAATAVAGKIAGAVAGTFGSFIGDFFGRTATQKLIPQVISAVAPIPVFVTNPGFGLPGGGGTPTPTPKGFNWKSLLPWLFGAGVLGAVAVGAEFATSPDRSPLINRPGGRLGPGDLPWNQNTDALEENTAAVKENTNPGAHKDTGSRAPKPILGPFKEQLLPLDDKALIAALEKTSEFGKAGVGTSIEHGILTGTDPFGEEALALFRRAEFPKQGRTLGEIERHIIAAEEVQKQYLQEGDINSATRTQAVIAGLHALLGSTDKTVAISEQVKRATQLYGGKLDILNAKDFSPDVRVSTVVNVTNSATQITQSIRRLITANATRLTDAGVGL